MRKVSAGAAKRISLGAGARSSTWIAVPNPGLRSSSIARARPTPLPLRSARAGEASAPSLRPGAPGCGRCRASPTGSLAGSPTARAGHKVGVLRDHEGPSLARQGEDAFVLRLVESELEKMLRVDPELRAQEGSRARAEAAHRPRASRLPLRPRSSGGSGAELRTEVKPRCPRARGRGTRRGSPRASRRPPAARARRSRAYACRGCTDGRRTARDRW